MAESDHELLKKKLRRLEWELSELEKKFDSTFKEVDLNNLAEEFIEKVLNDYWNLLDSHCRVQESKLNSVLLSREDLIQEALEYLLRWCLPKVREKSSRYVLWIPYLKRSIQNSFVNLANKQFTKRRYSQVSTMTDELIESYQDTQVDIEADYEFEELVALVKRRLSKRDRRILDQIINPSLSFKTYYSIIRSYCKVKSKKFSYREVIADYNDLSITTVNSVFNRFRNVIKEVL